MAEYKPNEIKVVAWFLQQKNLIKFTDGEATYSLDEKVIAVANFEKFPIRKGDTVEVGLKDNKVTFLRKKKSEPPKEQLSSEPKPSTQIESEVEEPKQLPDEKAQTSDTTAPINSSPELLKELTVFAVAANKKVVKFIELKDEGWFQIAENIQTQDYRTIGLIAKNKVYVQITEKTVVAILPNVEVEKPIEEPIVEAKEVKVESTPIQTVQTPPPSSYKKEWKPQSSYDSAEKQTSIEAQAAINAANQIVGRIAANIDPKPTASVLNSMIRAIAIENYNLIQELKKK